MSARTGRPIIGTGRRYLRLQVRMTEDEMRILDECAARAGCTRTDIVNRGIELVKRELDEKTE